MWRVFCGLLCLILLSACNDVSAPLPTLLKVPELSSTPTATVTPVPTRTPTATITSSPTITQTPLPSFTPAITSTRPPVITRTPTITQTPTPVLPLELDFDSVYPLQLELRQPVRDTLEQQRDLLPGHALTVTAFRTVSGMAKITLLPSFIIQRGWTQIEAYSHLRVEIFAQQIDTTNWRTYLLHPEIPRPDMPASFISPNPEIALAGEYRFPWAAGQGWWATAGWHGGNALDFQPAFSAGVSVLAAESGYLTELCRDAYQSLLMIQHADGHQTYYLHVRVGSQVRNSLLDQTVQRGQFLGTLIRQNRFNYACGQGGVPHLHFITSDRDLMIEGVSLEDIATNANCCKNPPVYISSNRAIMPGD